MRSTLDSSLKNTILKTIILFNEVLIGQRINTNKFYIFKIKILIFVMLFNVNLTVDITRFYSDYIIIESPTPFSFPVSLSGESEINRTYTRDWCANNEFRSRNIRSHSWKTDNEQAEKSVAGFGYTSP